MDENEFLFLSDTEITEVLAQRVKEARLHKNMTQKEFAAKAGISYDTYNKFERTGKISLQTFITVLRYLGLLKELANTFILDDIEKIGLKRYSQEQNLPKKQRASKK